MRSFGFESFKFEIIEECSEDVLKERELFYIRSLFAIENGYNALALEKHNNSKMTREDIIDIRTRYGNRERKKEVYKLYKDKINPTGFHKIWNFATWKSILPEVRTSENILFHKNNTAQIGESNGTTRLTNIDVIDIRTRKKNGESPEEVYADFKDVLTFRSFKNIWNGHNWKSITV